MAVIFNDRREEIIKSRLDGFRYYTLVKKEKGFTVSIGYRFYRVGIKIKELFFSDLANAVDFFDVRTNTHNPLTGRENNEFRITGKIAGPEQTS